MVLRARPALPIRPPYSTDFLHHLESDTLMRLTLALPRDGRRTMPRVLPALAVTATLVSLTACDSRAPSGEAASTASSAASSAGQTADPEQTTGVEPPTAPQDGTAQVITLTVAGG